MRHTKISDIEEKITDHDHGKYITTLEFNNLAARVFNVRLAQANLITKTDFDTELKKVSDRVTSNESKHLLAKNELKHFKNLMHPTLEAKIILMVMVLKII